MEGTGLPEGVHVTGRRIAVIGSGVSGITAGYVLSHTDYVTIFEADGRLGGHADTHLVTPPSGPPLGVDTGFIVYNERTYPLLTRLFAELGVATEPAEMSMSVRCAGCGLEYAGKRGLGGLTPGLLRGRQRARYLHEAGPEGTPVLIWPTRAPSGTASPTWKRPRKPSSG